MSDPLPPGSEPPSPAPPSVPPVSPSSPPPIEPVTASAPAAPVEPSKPGMTAAQWALVLHLSPLLALAVCCAPGVAIVGPLIVWLIKRPESAELDAIGKRVLNFQISYAIYSVAIGIASTVLSAVQIGWLLWPAGIAVGLAWLTFTIIGAVKQRRGEVYRPPFVLDLIK